MKEIIKQHNGLIVKVIDCDKCDNYHFYHKEIVDVRTGERAWMYKSSEPKCVFLNPIEKENEGTESTTSISKDDGNTR